MPLNLRRRKWAFALSSPVLAIQCHCPILFSPLAGEVSCAPSFCRLNTYLKFVNRMALETWLINSRMEHSSLNHQASQLPGTRSQVILCLSTKPVQSLAGGRKVTFVSRNMHRASRAPGRRVEHRWAGHPLCFSISAVQDQVCMTACSPGNTVFWMDPLFSIHRVPLAAEQSAHTLCSWAWLALSSDHGAHGLLSPRAQFRHRRAPGSGSSSWVPAS